jgi:hypothetical protein
VKYAGSVRRCVVVAVALAGCSSFELELDVSRVAAPNAEVRIDGVVVDDVYHATFDDYDAAKRARPRIEVLWHGGITDSWDGVVLACDWACYQGMSGCPDTIVSASLEVVVQSDYTIWKVYEGKCTIGDSETLAFAP